MHFNPSKCYILRISRTKVKFDCFYTLAGVVLNQVSETAYLGLEVSQDLKWDKHINKICKKANSTLGFLRRSLRNCPAKLKELAYIALVRSSLEYSSVVWCPYTVKNISKVEAVQRKAARFVKRNYSWDCSVTSMLKELNWSSLEERRKNASVTMLYKVVNGLVAVDASDVLVNSDRRTRANNSHSYRHFSSNTEQYKHSFYPRTIKIWNQLSEDTISSCSVDTFKAKLHTNSQ